MAAETTKALPRRAADALFKEVFRGRAIDIGGGNDPLKACPEFPELQVEYVVDLGGNQKNLLRANAEQLGERRPPPESTAFLLTNPFDLVYSSQTLEHMPNPFRALWNWWRLVKPGGHLVITVPDLELYEQGQWPHIWNSNHMTAWKHSKKTVELESSPGCIPLLELLQSLPNGIVSRCQLIDTNYDYSILEEVLSGARKPVDQTMPPYNAEAFIEAVVSKVK